MKKVLSLVLSLLMVISCMTCMFTTASAEGTAPLSYVSFNQTSDKNLMEGFNAADYIKSASKNYKGSAIDTTDADKVYEKGPAVYLPSTVKYQGYYIPLVDANGNSLLKLDRSYKFAIYLNTGNRLDAISVLHSATFRAEDGAVTSYEGVGNLTAGEKDSKGWTKYTIDITPKANVPHLIYIKFNSTAEATSTCAISDVSLYATDTRISADSAGTNGTATAVAGTNSVTFTAVPYQNSNFVGWYDGEELLGTEPTYTYNYETVCEKVITAKFSEINLLYGKNAPNVKQTSENSNDTGSAIYSAVSDTEGWWSNGCPRGMYELSTTSHLGGDAIYNPSVGYQYHVFTMLVKPNTTYSLQFSLLATHKVAHIGMFDNTGLFTYTANDSGAGTGGQQKPGLEPFHKWINGETDCSTFNTYSLEFTTNDSTAEQIPYYLYLGYLSEKEGENAADYEKGTYISDMSLVEYLRYDTTPTVVGNGVVKSTHKLATPGDTVTFTANAYDGYKFLGYYEGDTLLTSDTTYTYTANANTNVVAKFSGFNAAADLKPNEWYSFSGNDTVNCHYPVTNEIGDSYLGGSSALFGNIDYKSRYFCVDLAANTKYDISYYLKAYGEGSSVKLDAKATIYKKAELENYSANKTTIAAENTQYGFKNDIWEFRSTKYPEYCTYRQEVGGGFTATNEFTKVSTDFTTAEAGEYVILIKFAAVTGKANISDISISPVREAKVVTEGSGEATVTEDKGVYTYTATPYEGCEFIGWYNGKKAVSTNTTYLVTNLVDNLTLTAKFSSSANLLVGYNKDNILQRNNENWATKADATVTVGESTVNAIQLQGVGESAGKFYGTSWRTSAINLTAGHTYELAINVKSYVGIAYIGIISVENYTEGATPNDKTPWLEVSDWTYVPTKDGVMIFDHAAFADLKTFTPTVSGDYYICFTFNSITEPTEDELANIEDYKKAYFYDLSLIDDTSYRVNVTSTGNGAAMASPAKVTPGGTTTLTATQYATGGRFIGWFKDGNFVSSDTKFTVENVTENADYVARFTKTNIAEDLNYVGGSYGTTVAEAKVNEGWKKSKINSWVTLENANEESRYGGAALKATGTTQHQAYWLPITLKSGTTYTMGFSYYTSGVKANYIKLFDSTNFDIYDTIEEDPNTSYGGKVLEKLAQSEIVAFIGDVDSTVPEFRDYCQTFTTPESENATETFYLIVKHNGLTSDNSEGLNDYAILSDLSIVENGSADLEFATFKGNSIRAIGNQALRFKYDIASDILTSGFEGFTVKEVGAVMLRTTYLGNQELTLDGVYVNSNGKEVSLAKGNLAYGVFTEEILESAPAVALYNIGGKRDPAGNIISTDYTDYGSNYTVRAYIVIDLGGTDVVLYGEERTASVFAVMDAILDSTSTDEQTLADKEAVNTVLASAADEGKTIQAYYDAWKNQ